MFGGFQISGFQANAFQIITSGSPVEPESAVPGGTVYHAPYHKYREEERKREQIRKDKSELEKLQSVLQENERKKALAAQSLIEAKAKKDKERLARLEQEYLDEINRLLAVRAMLLQRMKKNQGALIVFMAMKRRRLRAGQWQAIPLANNIKE